MLIQRQMNQIRMKWTCFLTGLTKVKNRRRNKNERLQKVIANAGITSRRKAEKLIQEGKVTVNGKVVTELGVKVSGTSELKLREFN